MLNRQILWHLVISRQIGSTLTNDTASLEVYKGG